MNEENRVEKGLLGGILPAGRLLGLSAILVVTSSLYQALGMGASMVAILTLSGAILSAARTYLPEPIRLVSAILVTATLGVTAEMLLLAFFPTLAAELGMFLPLLTVTCVLVDQGGEFAYRNPVKASVLHGLFQALKYALVLLLTGAARELLGRGSFGVGLLNGGRGIQVFPGQYAADGLLMPVGGFLVLGCVAALGQALADRPRRPRGQGKEGER